MKLLDIRFRDIAGRERNERDSLRLRKRQLDDLAEKRTLSPAEEREREEIANILEQIEKSRDNHAPEVADKVFVAARKLLNEGDDLQDDDLTSQKDGHLVLREGGPEAPSDEVANRAVVRAALTIGLLLADKAEAPPLKIVNQVEGGQSGDEAGESDPVMGKTLVPDTSHKSWARFTSTFFCALGEMRGQFELAMLVLPTLSREGDPDEAGAKVATVDAEEFARVMRDLMRRNVTTAENQLRRRVNEALDKVQRVGDFDKVVDIGIDLPDLDEFEDVDIIEENVRLMGPMIVSAMFDEMQAFQAVDSMVDRWRDGSLAIGSGEAGKLLYRYWREAPNRISELERQTFYAITMGVPGGENADRTNTEFNDLWIRFVSSVSEFVRQAEVDKLIRTKLPSPISHQQVRKSARDLSMNLSLFGYGMAYYAAVELQQQIKFMIELLSDDEIKTAYGARDMWQVIDKIAILDLGGARNTTRYRTLATCGTIITAWLANNINRIRRATGPVLNIEQIQMPSAKLEGQKATRTPDDFDLVNACELWLADTAVPDARVEELSQPREAPVQTSAPVQMPAVVRDMLEGMGDLGVGLGHRR